VTLPPTTARERIADLALFPLGLVLFPGALLSLRIFEARYLDLMAHCLRSGEPFGVVTLNRGSEVRTPAGAADGSGSSSVAAVEFAPQGCLAVLQDCDAVQSGLLLVRCSGTHRFKIGPAHQDKNGLWRADAELLADDPALAPPDDCRSAVQALRLACASLAAQGGLPFQEPLAFDDAAWVANRWCEILPIPPATKLKLMMLSDAQARLRLVADFLRRKGIVSTD
jgi:Lon protease-like protein